MGCWSEYIELRGDLGVAGLRCVLVAKRSVVGGVPEPCHQLLGGGARPRSHRAALMAKIMQGELGEPSRPPSFIEARL